MIVMKSRQAAIVAGLACQVLLLPPLHAANAAPSPYISTPTARVVGVTSSSFTIVAHAARAKHYRVFASHNKHAVSYKALTSSHPRAARSAVSPTRVTLGGLHYTAAPYYFRVEGLNHPHRRFSAIYSVGLRPPAPRGLAASSSGHASYLTWQSAAHGYRVEQARDPGFTSQVRAYRLHGRVGQLTPYGLQPGQTYFFRLRAVNHGTPSPQSGAVSVTAHARQQPVRVMTYNIKEASFDGSREGGRRVAAWSKRRVAAAQLIRRANPDVVAIQEGATYVGRHLRQVVSLRRALGHEYKLAHTEIPAGHRHHFRTGCYILYKSATYRAVHRGNHWKLGTRRFQRYAAYQLLENRRSHARFLLVDPHLLVGNGLRADRRRETETKMLLRKSHKYAARHHVRVVYAGDFNSHPVSHHITLDGPGRAMRFAHVADAFEVAQSRSNKRFDSDNDYLRRPPAFGADIDHIYVAPGIAVRSWRLVLRLRHGRFVGVIPSDHNPVVANIDIPY